MNPSPRRPWRRIVLWLVAAAAVIGFLGWREWARRPPRQREPIADSHVPELGEGARFGGEDISREALAGRGDEGYVGSQACAGCHAEISESFARHPMRQSLAPVAEARLVEDYSRPAFAPPGPWRYRVEREGTRVRHHEEMIPLDRRKPRAGDAGESLYDQAVEISYALGSGTRGRSYLIDRDGQFFVSPINWYSAARRWDLAPGYPPENHLRFERLVREECLSCHAGRTSPAQPEVARFAEPPFLEVAIGCERCHGPGRRHVEGQHAGSDNADLSSEIINPAKLDPERRESVCNQCHLHGEIRIPRHGRELADFRPGEHLDEVLSVLVQPAPPSDKGALRAVSQVEQMQASACFKMSAGKLGCISCHDPHAVPEQQQRRGYFNAKCQKCHADQGCSLPEDARRAAEGSCIDCHMPRGEAGGVPHTAQTDHRIRRQPGTGAAALTNDPSALVFFGSSSGRLSEVEQSRARGIMLVELASQRRDRVRMAAQAEKLLRRALADQPDDVATMHCLALACLRQNRQRDALEIWEQVLERQPHRLETLQAYAELCQSIGEVEKAERALARLLRVSPWQAEYQWRYAQLLAAAGNWEEALAPATCAVELDPSRPEYRELLAVTLSRLGRDAESRRQLEILQKIVTATSH